MASELTLFILLEKVIIEHVLCFPPLCFPGKVVTGSYQVYLPDGRVQTVTYTADHHNGYLADVKYEGTPVYPKYEPKPYKSVHA